MPDTNSGPESAGDAGPGHAPTPAAAEQNTQPKENGTREIVTREIGGREGPEPTRFGDWEKAGRCIDF
jgi:hypothetical protein